MPPLTKRWTGQLSRVTRVDVNSALHSHHSRAYSTARKIVLVMTAFTSLLFVQLYRSNLLLHIIRLEAPATPNTLAEVVQAVENGSYLTQLQCQM
mgnify:CR=1 FL=1